MNRPYMLDAGPLGKIAHPKAKLDIALWFDSMLDKGKTIIIAEIADYEIRRSLLLAGLDKSIAKLDNLKSTLQYLPITTEAMLKAAELWADARRKGTPTADPKELDCDVVLAAQALSVNAIVVTENIGHLDRFVEAKHWKDISS